MNKIFLVLLISFLTRSIYAGCVQDLSTVKVESCRAKQQVGAIRECLKRIEVQMATCKKELSSREAELSSRNDKILLGETFKIKEVTSKLLANMVTDKQNARYVAMKALDDDIIAYSDDIKNAIAHSGLAYRDFKAINLQSDNDTDRKQKISLIEKIIARLNSESRNAQIYFNEAKPNFLVKEALLNLNIINNALIPVNNLKKQNDSIISLMRDAADNFKYDLNKTNDEGGIINFPDSFENLVRESENQELLITACRNNTSDECKKYARIHDAYHDKISQKIETSQDEVAHIENLVLKNKILEARKNDNLIEYGRLYDFAKKDGSIK